MQINYESPSGHMHEDTLYIWWLGYNMSCGGGLIMDIVTPIFVYKNGVCDHCWES